MNMANSNVNPNAHACSDPRLRFLAPMNGNVTQVGNEVSFIGTAVYPEAVRYKVEARLRETETWQELGSQRNSDKFSTLATWNTKDATPGVYDIRLTAVDSNNIRLSNSPNCLINIELQP